MFAILVLFVFCWSLAAQAPQPFVTRCAGCHGADARGTAQAPGLAQNPRVARQSADELREYLRHGNVPAGMPSFQDAPAGELQTLAQYLRRINNDTILTPTAADAGARITWGMPQPGDWLTYNGDVSGNRYSALKQITTENVASLHVKWVFPIQHFGLETTPLAADGVVYVTGPNQVFALDALSGGVLWQYARPQSRDLRGDASLGTNRGIALREDKVFFLTDNARLLALDRASGKLVWETPMVPASNQSQPYGGTVAPLIVGDLVIAGVAGGDHGLRGFVSAYQAATGEMVWRRWTVPASGERGIETWQGKEPVGGGGSTWLTGSYDAASNTLYWATGNPWPDSDDRDRPGDNLFTNCVLALDPKTGEIKWHYQFTPHDLKDRDATEPNVLVDATWRGTPSKLLLHADRNGFFYVLDRTHGNVLLAEPFLKRVDWASKIGPDGRPVVTDPKGCPGDAANWDSTAFSPLTRLYYVMTLEECTGAPTGYPDRTGQFYLRAMNIETGKVVWEQAQPGAARAKSWGGVLATAGGVLFYTQPNGGIAAADQKTGRMLWRFPTNVRMKASPMTFLYKANQYVVVAAGPNVICLGL